MSKTFGKQKKQVDETSCNKDVRFPALFEAGQSCSDPYWKAILIDMSKNKCPKKVQCDAQTITFGHKRNLQSYKYIDKSPSEIVEEIKEKFKKTLGLFSTEDFKNQSTNIFNQFEQFNQITDLNDWKKIKNKKMKENLLFDFALSRKELLDLNWTQFRLLHTVIENAIFNLRTHGSDDIMMQGGQVVEINDIEIDEDGYAENPRMFDLEDNTEKDAKKSVKDKWGSYIKSLVEDLR
jgi:hypothetical protein